MAETEITPPQIFALGDRALVVEFGRTQTAAVLARVRAAAEHLLAHPLPCVTDVVPAYAVVTVHFDPIAAMAHHRATNPLDAMREAVAAAIAKAPEASKRRVRTIEIPVCYGGEFGEDIEDVAKHCRITTDEVVRLHTAPTYEVAMLGFVPGFGYLTGLDRKLATPRRDTPRKRVVTGSVGIGGDQTAVYPMESPGGWQVIGRTPMALFRVDDIASPTVLRAGDHVRFVAIDAAEYARTKAGAR